MPAPDSGGMDTFVVRIRQPSHGKLELRGVVDEVATGDRSTFHNSEELLLILLGNAPDRASQDAGATSQ
jgi:hypothetical protein